MIYLLFVNFFFFADEAYIYYYYNTYITPFSGSYDFIGINYYSAYKIRPLTSEEYENADDIKTKDMGFVADNDDDIENVLAKIKNIKNKWQ